VTALSQPASRCVWLWCVAYTAVAPREPRGRRRDEIRSHLWESEHARLPQWVVAVAALRGIGHDVLWAATRGLPQLVRSFATPTPYVVLAPAFPIQGWIVSTLVIGHTAQVSESIGAFGGGGMLLLAGLVWLAGRRSQ